MKPVAIASATSVVRNRRPARILALWAVVYLALFWSLAPARAAPDGTVTLDAIDRGALVLRTKDPGLFIEAPQVAADMAIEVSGPVARARITQRFENPSDQWVEGLYLFPLPEDAAVDTLRIQIGARFIEGTIKERQEARAQYEAARASGQKAALLEQQRPNMFTNAVANIGPHETVVVQFDYQETLTWKDGAMTLRLPLVVGPRYSPPLQASLVGAGAAGGLLAAIHDPVPDRDAIAAPVRRPEWGPVNPVSLRIALDAGFPLARIDSTTHAIRVERQGRGKAVVTLDGADIPADRDFALTSRRAADKAPAATLLTETVEGHVYLLAHLVPPSGDEKPAALPRETIFVIDNSGSMAGPSMAEAKASLLFALDRLTADDLFNVIRFDDTLDIVFPTAVPADRANVARARHFVAGLDANGGTEMLPALRAALRDPTPGERGRLRQIVFLTDGSVGNESELLAALTHGLGRSRLFTVGIGSAPNGYFMAHAARLGRGTYTYIGAAEEVEERMAALFEVLSAPALTNVAARFEGGAPGETWPNPLPDLYEGEPLLITARRSGAAGTLVLTGERAGEPWEARLDLAEARPGGGIARLWARHKIEAIEDTRYAGAPLPAIDAAVLEVALGHRLVSRMTSLLAVDVTPARPADATLAPRAVPLNLPAGWDFDAVFGPEIERRVEERRATAPLPATTLAALAGAPGPTDPADSAETVPGLVLPQGSTHWPLLLAIGLAVALLGAACLARSDRRRPGLGR